MKIDQRRLSDLQDSVTHFLICAFAASDKADVEVPLSEDYDLTITINNVELPTEEVIRYLYDLFELDAKNQAATLLRQQIEGGKELLENLVESISTEMDNTRLKLCELLRTEV